MQNSEINQPLHMEYRPAQSYWEIQLAWQLMSSEFLSQGGNLRDQTQEVFLTFAQEKGTVWAAFQNQQLVAVCTSERVHSQGGTWVYINNGVVDKQWRHQRSGVMDRLLATLVAAYPPDTNLIVITVVWNMFERLGFSAVTIDELHEMDSNIGLLISQKLRKDKQAWIGLKHGQVLSER